MNTIVSTSDIQKNIWALSRKMEQKRSITVVKNGKAKMVILPYFENNDDLIEDYLEEYEIQQNQKKLEKELQDSEKSGISDFSI